MTEKILIALDTERHLVPLLQVSDEALPHSALPVPESPLSVNARGWTLQAAAEGRLRDPWFEAHEQAWVYQGPPDSQHQWWNGFVYSSWQLLDLTSLRHPIAALAGSHDDPVAPTLSSGGSAEDAAYSRRYRTVALTLLANRYLPGVLGQATLPAGAEWDTWDDSRCEGSVAALLSAANIDPSDLAALGENLLVEAQWDDPLKNWLPLIRHMNYSSWTKLRGPALASLWQRIGAELLLQAHEALAEEGAVAPLPDVDRFAAWHPLADRIGGQAAERAPLESTLSRFGLTPHPRLLLLVEGESDRIHYHRLLQVLGFKGSSYIRLHTLDSARTNPQLLARYVVSPQLGVERNNGWELAVPPTALLIVADPEGRWATGSKRSDGERRLKAAVRKDVEMQGAKISDEVLDLLVKVEVLDHSHEFANFSDDELLLALQAIATRNLVDNADSDEWRQQVRSDLVKARSERLNIEIALRHARADKLDLAEQLWPVMEARVHAEVSSEIVTPAIDIAIKAMERAALMHRGSVVLPIPLDGRNPAGEPVP